MIYVSFLSKVLLYIGFGVACINGNVRLGKVKKYLDQTKLLL
jgi:hypothetical protein